MNKNFFQDVIPPGRRSIRNVPITGVRRKKKMPPEGTPIEEFIQEGEGSNVVSRENYSKPAFPRNKKRFFSGKVFIILAIILIAGFIFGMMTAFTSASINIVPKKETVSFNMALKAEKNPSLGSGALRFEVVEIKRESQKEVNANGEEMVEKKASGTITIYNNFSKEAQRLITRTRFETPDGLIFRIAESITVPGKTAGGPGQIEVKAYADEAGPQHNIGKTDFTVPGFKNDPARYKGFYAKSKTSMEGGFIGKIKKVNEADKAIAMKALEDEARVELQKEAGAQIPDGFTALNGSTVYEFKDLGQAESGSKAILKSEAVAFVVVFDTQSLASIIAKQFLPAWDGIPVQIRSFDNMAVSFDPSINISTGNIPSAIPLKLSGSAEVFAAINGIEVAEALKGLPKTSLNGVMASFPGVSSARAAIRPLWKGNFPANTAKIYINVE